MKGDIMLWYQTGDLELSLNLSFVFVLYYRRTCVHSIFVIKILYKFSSLHLKVPITKSDSLENLKFTFWNFV